MPREHLVIFISSPGDVRPERGAAERIVARLARQFAAHFDISSVRWEREPLRATADFQSQIPRACLSDIVVVILWSRLGSLLDETQHPGPVSGGPVTGTEYEFEDALNGRDGVRPALFVYRKTGIPQFTDERQILEYPEQSRRVKRFFDTWISRVAHHTFSDIVSFEELLSDHLSGEIRGRIRTPHPEVAARWFHGSPFKGLETFGRDDGPIFFGRARAQTELEQLLLRQSGRGRPWAVVLGPSGSGKSSLVKAGVLPDITSPGFVPGVGSCRYAVLRPAETRGDLIGGLAAALMAPAALPELAGLQYTPPDLANILKVWSAAATPLKQGLAAARVADKVLDHAQVRLAIILDQLEELFTVPFPPDAIRQLVEVLDALATTGTVWILATLRTDFLQDLERSTELAARFDSDSRYLLAAPNEAELSQIIERPAEAAGLTFAVDDASGVRLGEAIRIAARASPAALPLLEYLLEQLWHRRTEGAVLTWEAYRALGELEGAIGSRAEEVYAGLPDAARESLPKVLRALATVAPGEKRVAMARNVPLDLFPPGTPPRMLIDAFADTRARLLVKHGDPTPQVRVAHEALLRSWPRARQYLEADANDLQLRYRLEEQSDLWSATRDVSRLLSPGLPLSEAQDLLGRRGDELNPTTVELINASRAAYEDELDQERRRRIEAEWREAQAELAQLRAGAEEYFARATETGRRTGSIGGETWQARSAALSTEGNRLLTLAYELHRKLRGHPGATARVEAPDQVFSLEAIVAAQGECLLVHYGDATAPRLILVDGGPRGTFRDFLLPRLETLRSRRARGGTLAIELVVVSHYDADRVAGIFELLRHLASDGAGAFRIERLWYNNFHAIIPPSEREGSSFKEELRELADLLSIPINAPFEYFVMPSAAGPTRLTLPGGLEITITGPPFDSVRTWYRQWMKDQARRGSVPSSLKRALSSPEREAASGVELRLLRTPPASFDPGFDGRQPDLSVANLSSIVAHLRFRDRTMLLTGDARADHIQRGLFDAWLLDPDAGMDVDLLKLPHFGSMHNCTEGMLERVRAQHYVVTENRLFRLPGPEIFGAIARARGASPHTVHTGKPVLVNLLSQLAD